LTATTTTFLRSTATRQLGVVSASAACPCIVPDWAGEREWARPFSCITRPFYPTRPCRRTSHACVRTAAPSAGLFPVLDHPYNNEVPSLITHSIFRRPIHRRGSSNAYRRNSGIHSPSITHGPDPAFEVQSLLVRQSIGLRLLKSLYGRMMG